VGVVGQTEEAQGLQVVPHHAAVSDHRVGVVRGTLGATCDGGVGHRQRDQPGSPGLLGALHGQTVLIPLEEESVLHATGVAAQDGAELDRLQDGHVHPLSGLAPHLVPVLLGELGAHGPTLVVDQPVLVADLEEAGPVLDRHQLSAGAHVADGVATQGGVHLLDVGDRELRVHVHDDVAGHATTGTHVVQLLGDRGVDETQGLLDLGELPVDGVLGVGTQPGLAVTAGDREDVPDLVPLLGQVHRPGHTLAVGDGQSGVGHGATVLQEPVVHRATHDRGHVDDEAGEGQQHRLGLGAEIVLGGQVDVGLHRAQVERDEVLDDVVPPHDGVHHHASGDTARLQREDTLQTEGLTDGATRVVVGGVLVGGLQEVDRGRGVPVTQCLGVLLGQVRQGELRELDHLPAAQLGGGEVVAIVVAEHRVLAPTVRGAVQDDDLLAGLGHRAEHHTVEVVEVRTTVVLVVLDEVQVVHDDHVGVPPDAGLTTLDVLHAEAHHAGSGQRHHLHAPSCGDGDVGEPVHDLLAVTASRPPDGALEHATDSLTGERVAVTQVQATGDPLQSAPGSDDVLHHLVVLVAEADLDVLQLLGRLDEGALVDAVHQTGVQVCQHLADAVREHDLLQVDEGLQVSASGRVPLLGLHREVDTALGSGHATLEALQAGEDSDVVDPQLGAGLHHERVRHDAEVALQHAVLAQVGEVDHLSAVEALGHQLDLPVLLLVEEHLADPASHEVLVHGTGDDASAVHGLDVEVVHVGDASSVDLRDLLVGAEDVDVVHHVGVDREGHLTLLLQADHGVDTVDDGATVEPTGELTRGQETGDPLHDLGLLLDDESGVEQGLVPGHRVVGADEGTELALGVEHLGVALGEREHSSAVLGVGRDPRQGQVHEVPVDDAQADREVASDSAVDQLTVVGHPGVLDTVDAGSDEPEAELERRTDDVAVHEVLVHLHLLVVGRGRVIDLLFGPPVHEAREGLGVDVVGHLEGLGVPATHPLDGQRHTLQLDGAVHDGLLSVVGRIAHLIPSLRLRKVINMLASWTLRS